MASLTSSEEKQLQEVITKFPTILAQAKIDWAKFKAGVAAGLFPANSANRREVISWFKEFPKLWDGIKPNYEIKTGDGRVDAELSYIYRTASDFAARLRTEPEIANNLGIAPLIIAGIAIAAAFGIGGVIWAIGYLKKQANISSMIDNVVAGKLPPEVLEEAIKKENEGGILSDITGLLKWAAIGAALYLLYPAISNILKPKTKGA